jgi:SAM-dependent methyltransferase
MRRWARAAAVAALAVLTGALIFFIRRVSTPVPDRPAVRSPAPALSASTDITVRNVTSHPVAYSIRPGEEGRPGAKALIAPGAVERFRPGGPVVIEFERGGEPVSRTLSPGKAYSFRYDDDGTVEIWLGAHGRPDAADLAPFVATPDVIVEKMLTMAGVDKDDIVYDIGCGDGRIVVTAAVKFGARGVGIDIDPERIREGRENARSAGVEGLVRFIEADATRTDISEATILALYLLPESNALLRPKLDRELKPGTPVVSHNYSIPGWEDKEVDSVRLNDGQGKEHVVFLYRK